MLLMLSLYQARGRRRIPHMAYLFYCLALLAGGELRRSYLPRTAVNKGRKKDQNPDEVIPWPFFLEARLAAYPDGCSMIPSCCIIPSRSALVQCSTILPPSMRFVLTLLTSTFLPVAGMSQSSPWWVPLP